MTTVVDDGLSEDLSADLAAAAFALSRQFAAGATMWSLSPSWEPHAQHIAVEFVHPVIVGKRALPAVALTGLDLLSTARLSVRAGDIIVAVADAADPDVQAVMRRGPAWGATTVWIGHGPRPPEGSADHTLWIDDPDPRLPATGGFVLLYHLLWELTHVCFEHPGLLTEQPAECEEEVCITCSDEGRLGEVVAVHERGAAQVRTASGIEAVDISLVEPVAVGDLLLVHAGMAITTVDEGVSER